MPSASVPPSTSVMPAYPIDRERCLHDATVAMMRSRSLTEVCERIISTVIALSHAHTATIMLTHETGEYLECVAAGGRRGGEYLGTRRDAGQGLSGTTWSAGVPRFVEDASDVDTHGRWHEPTQAYLYPLGNGRGVIAAFAGRIDGDLRADIERLTRIGELSCASIHNVRAAEAVGRALSRTHALGEVSRQLFEIDNATEACDAACRMLLAAADIMRASSFLIDASGRLVPHVSWRMGPAGIEAGARIPAELVRFSIAQRAVDSASSVQVLREEMHAPHSTRLETALSQQNIGAAMALPLLKAGTPVGAIVVTRHRARRNLTAAEIDVCRTVVNQLSTTLERADLARELEHRAWHDGLTGLPNRSRFETTLGELLVRDRPEVAVLFIDLDGFKRINDTLGHARGDALLEHVARRLQSVIKRSDLLARMGGDEFAILLRENHGATAVAERVLNALRTPFDLGGERVRIGASLGLCRCPSDGDSVDTLLRHADVAMYHAKHARGGGLVRFTRELARAAHEREALESELERALVHRQFELAYQPQVACRDGRVAGLEALIRWHHPERGLVRPADFIPVAETSDLINRIGAWVIEEAAGRLGAWRGTPLDGIRLSINIAASQFQQADFVESVLDTLTRHGTAPELLELEVTERVVMRDIADVADRLQRLRAAGLRIAIDDFGTGYSSLSYLQDLPLDVLKIDRAFVTHLQPHGENDQTLVNTILLLGSSLGLGSVAEGVETRAQAEALANLGCDLIQGDFHSVPVFEPALIDAVRRIERSARPARSDDHDETSTNACRASAASR